MSLNFRKLTPNFAAEVSDVDLRQVQDEPTLAAIRRGMELKIASAGEWRPAALGGSSGVHKDILEGRDCEIGWEDVFTGKLVLRMALWVSGCVLLQSD